MEEMEGRNTAFVSVGSLFLLKRKKPEAGHVFSELSVKNPTLKPDPVDDEPGAGGGSEPDNRFPGAVTVPARGHTCVSQLPGTR